MESNHLFSLPYLQVLRQACHQFPHFITLLAAKYNIMIFSYETKRIGCITSGELNEENFPESGPHVPQIKFISVGTYFYFKLGKLIRLYRFVRPIKYLAL